ASDRRKLSRAARTVDALMVLNALAPHPKIDGNRVGKPDTLFGALFHMVRRIAEQSKQSSVLT
ncbi:MAG: hypothetical protein OXF88_03415, partial [Rhodobacteraceae bacterium]|nr:hypothetical protein [Paracoccaceae bacterium]